MADTLVMTLRMHTFLQSLFLGLVLACCGCGTLTRYYSASSPSEQEQQAVFSCLENVLSARGFRRVPCNSVTFRGHRLDCVRRYTANSSITVTAAIDSQNHIIYILPHPVPAYRHEPQILRAARQDLEKCFDENLGSGRVKLTESWKQNWVWNVIELEN